MVKSKLILKVALGMMCAFVSNVLTACDVSVSRVQVQEVHAEVRSASSIEGVGTVSIKQELVSGQETFHLLATFDNPVEALENARANNIDAVHLLQLQNPWLGPFSRWNWFFYRDALNRLYGVAGTGDTEMDEQLYALQCFFDIYENNDENARIIARARHEGIDVVRDELEALP